MTDFINFRAPQTRLLMRKRPTHPNASPAMGSLSTRVEAIPKVEAVLVGRRSAQSGPPDSPCAHLRAGDPAAADGRKRRTTASENTTAGKRRVSAHTDSSTSTEATRSYITWNVGGLRALLRDEGGVDALRSLLAEGPAILCLLEHKLQSPPHKESVEAKQRLESVASEAGYACVWTYSPRPGLDGLVALVAQSQLGATRSPTEPSLASAAACSERRLLTLELDDLHVLFCYAPNSGRPGRLAFRLEEWEPSIRALIVGMQERSGGKPVLYQGDLNVAHVRELDAWGKTDAQFGGYKASGR